MANTQYGNVCKNHKQQNPYIYENKLNVHDDANWMRMQCYAGLIYIYIYELKKCAALYTRASYILLYEVNHASNKQFSMRFKFTQLRSTEKKTF